MFECITKEDSPRSSASSPLAKMDVWVAEERSSYRFHNKEPIPRVTVLCNPLKATYYTCDIMDSKSKNGCRRIERNIRRIFSQIILLIRVLQWIREGIISNKNGTGENIWESNFQQFTIASVIQRWIMRIFSFFCQEIFFQILHGKCPFKGTLRTIPISEGWSQRLKISSLITENVGRNILLINRILFRLNAKAH